MSLRQAQLPRRPRSSARPARCPVPARPHHLRLLQLLRAGLAAVVVAVVVVAASPRLLGRAGAAVVHDVGFEATVGGWMSWYGSYRLGSLGVVWCVDHGLS